MTRRAVLVAFVVAGAAVVWASSAGAHTTIAGASPTAGQTVGGTVERIRIDFFAPVTDAAVFVTSPSGADVPGSLDADRGERIEFGVDALDENGEYIVEWSVVTGDGDRQASAFAFTYDRDAPQVAGTARGDDDRGGAFAAPAAVALALLALLAGRGHLSHRRQQTDRSIKMGARQGN